MGKCSLYYHVFVLEKRSPDLTLHFLVRFVRITTQCIEGLTQPSWIFGEVLIINNNIWLFDLCHWKHGSCDRKRISEVEPTCVIWLQVKGKESDTIEQHTRRKGKVSTELLKGFSLEKGNDLPKMINYCIYRHLLKGHPWLFSGWVSVLSLVGLRVWTLVRKLRLCMLVKGKIQKNTTSDK